MTSRHGLTPALSVRRIPRKRVPAPRLVEVISNEPAANEVCTTPCVAFTHQQGKGCECSRISTVSALRGMTPRWTRRQWFAMALYLFVAVTSTWKGR